MMNASLALIVAAVVFGLVALIHVVRLCYKTEIRIAEKIIPVWVSIPGCIVALLLAFWMFAVGISVM